MKLEGSLFTVIAGPDRQSPETGVYRIRLNPDHTIYKAHFPELPITPGVILVRVGMELLSDFLGRKVHLVGAPNIKFTAPVYPENGKELEYEINVKICFLRSHSSQSSVPSSPAAPRNDSDGPSSATIVVKDSETIYSKQSLRYE